MTPLQEINEFADLRLDVEVQLDSKRMKIKEILELDTHSVIRLPRSAGESIDVLIGGTPVCFGEIVIIDDTVGVRITDFREDD